VGGRETTGAGMSPSAEAIPSELVGTWDIDPNHSTIEAVARYAMLSNVRGHFDTFSGTIAVGQTLSQSSVEVEIVAASVNTGVEMRDNHLRSADFMDAEHHPKITFRSTRVEPAGEDRYRVRGDFTLRGVTKGLELDVQFEGIGPDPWGNTRAGIFARTTINRKDFGANWNAILETGGVLVGDSLKIELNVSAVKRKTDQATPETQFDASAEAEAKTDAQS
jgi:polyisoprenoid-binding protein YceI